MSTQELKQEFMRIIRELGKEGVEVELKGETLFEINPPNTVIHTVTFKEKDQC